MRNAETIIEELENCFIGHDEYILDLLVKLKESCAEKDRQIKELEVEFRGIKAAWKETSEWLNEERLKNKELEVLLDEIINELPYRIDGFENAKRDAEESGDLFHGEYQDALETMIWILDSIRNHKSATGESDTRLEKAHRELNAFDVLVDENELDDDNDLFIALTFWKAGQKFEETSRLIEDPVVAKKAIGETCPECGLDPGLICSGAGQCDWSGRECGFDNNCGEYKPIPCTACHGTGKKPEAPEIRISNELYPDDSKDGE